MMQRFFDILFSVLALLILLPLFIPLCLVLRLTAEGHVFFFQPRIGRDGKIFGLIKFATMLKDSPSIGTGTITIDNDPRILPFGRYLRKSKINELPQLINVLVGEMSLVGPRPLTEENFLLYDTKVQKCIKSVAPGLSGIQQVVIKDEESLIKKSGNAQKFYSETLAPYKGKLEVWYVNDRSLYVYFSVIFCTVWNFIAPNNLVVWTLFNNLPKPPVTLPTQLAGWQKINSRANETS